MSDTSSGRGRSKAKKSAKKKAKRKDTHASEGVLANLPRTRPQRSSARRDAARRTASAKEEPPGAPARKPRRTASATAQPAPTPTYKPPPTISTKAEPTPAPKRIPVKKRPSKSKVKAKRLQDPAPRQGFETEGDPVSGPVQPPGGVDLLSSAAELAGELTKSGLSTGGRLLKDVFARLPLN
jgi:hypothetical protein